MSIFSLSKDCRLFKLWINNQFVYRCKGTVKFDGAFNYNCEILGLQPDCVDHESVRRAFLNLCRKYHPDSGGTSADSEKFHEVESAYRYFQLRFAKQRWDVLDEEGNEHDKAVEHDIQHVAPQHRTHLSWYGVGYGTPSQRQRQYAQKRAAEAAIKVMEHRMPPAEETLPVLDKRNLRTRQGMDRLVEDLIQDSMARGEFSNLKGAGKPLKEKPFNPHLDFITQKINEILIDNGFTPEWITKSREINEEIERIRKIIREKIRFFNKPEIWEEVYSSLEQSAGNLNKQIQSFNLIVPILNKQMFLFDLKKEIEAAKSLPPLESENVPQKTDLRKRSADSDENIFGLFKDLFKMQS